MTFRLIDPLAQSFFVEEPCVITKVDLYFSAKDDTLPVTVQIRKNEAGLPGPYIIPFSETIVYPSSIVVSANANVASTVSFSNPVFLDSGEYSLTLGSSSKNYRVYVSELGQTDIISSKRITEQPYVGSLFKSQNATTWNPVQTEDLKFDLYRANFTPNVITNIEFFGDIAPFTRKVLVADPLELFPNSPIMRVYHENHSMSDGSIVQISGVSNAYIAGNVLIPNTFYGILANTIEGQNFTISNVTFESYTVALSASANTSSSVRFGGPSVTASQDLRYDTVYPVVSVINKDGAIDLGLKATRTNYAVDSAFIDLSFGDNDLDESKILSSNVNRQAFMSNANTLIFKVELSTTNPLVSPLLDTKQLGLVLATNIVNNPTYNNTTLPFDETTICNTTTANIYQLSGNIGLLSLTNANDIANARAIVKGTLLTISNTNPNNGTYRVMDVLDSGANIKIFDLNGSITTDSDISNVYTVVNGTKFIAEEAAESGSIFSKYITRQVDFVNPSTTINFRLDVTKPQNAELEFYVKTKLVGETEILSNKEYTKIDGVVIPTSIAGEYYEIEKQIDNLEPFNALVFKVVFKTTDSAKVPKIKNLRIIALE